MWGNCVVRASPFQREWHQELQHYSRYYNQNLLTDAGIALDDFTFWFLGKFKITKEN